MYDAYQLSPVGWTWKRPADGNLSPVSFDLDDLATIAASQEDGPNQQAAGDGARRMNKMAGDVDLSSAGLQES